MVDRQCTKRFPKQFLECTEQGNDRYPKYRRRKPEDGGSTRKIMMRQDGKQVEQEVTNQWVVPYNPFQGSGRDRPVPECQVCRKQ